MVTNSGGLSIVKGLTMEDFKVERVEYAHHNSAVLIFGEVAGVPAIIAAGFKSLNGEVVTAIGEASSYADMEDMRDWIATVAPKFRG